MASLTEAGTLTLNDADGGNTYKHDVAMARQGSDKDGLNEQSIARGNNTWARFRYEFKTENLWFSGNYPHTYGRLHWARAFGIAGSGCWCCSRARGNELNASFRPLSPWIWIPWRIFVAAYLMGVFLYSIINFWDEGTWFYYLTNWQSTIFMIYGLSALVSAIYIHVTQYESLCGELNESAKLIGADKNAPKGAYRIPVLVKTTWVLHGLSMSLGIWVTLMFWLNAAVFGPPNPNRVAYELIDHFSTVFLVLIDFSIASFPWLIFQFVWSSSIAIAFVIWSIIHYNVGLTNKFDNGHYIYKGLDWSNPRLTGIGVAILIVFGIPLVSFVVWALSSEAMGKCAPRRLVPWIDQDGTGGHRLKSYKKGLASPVKSKEEEKAVVPVLNDEDV